MSAFGLHFPSRAFETVNPSRDQADISAPPGECPGRGATDAGRRARDHDYLFHRVRSDDEAMASCCVP
jgi:hypothetical protein